MKPAGGTCLYKKKKRSDKLNEWWAIAIWTNIATSIYNQALTLLLVSDPLTNFCI